MKKSEVTKYIGKFKYKIECIYLFDTDTIPYELIFIRQKNKETLTLKIIVKGFILLMIISVKNIIILFVFLELKKGMVKHSKLVTFLAH